MGFFLFLCALAWGMGTIADRLRPVFLELRHEQATTVQEFSLEQFRAFVSEKKGIILDARTETAYRDGHIPGALSFPGTYFEGSYLKVGPKLEASRLLPIAVYCADAGCSTSTHVGRELLRQGFPRVFVFSGGWKVWKNAGLPVEGGS